MTDFDVEDFGNRDQYTVTVLGQTEFDITFQFFETTDIEVFQTPNGQVANPIADVLVEGVDYTITQYANGTGLMTLVVGAAIGDEILNNRAVPMTNDSDYQVGGRLPSLSFDLLFDKIFILIQQVYYLINDRGVLYQVNEVLDEGQRTLPKLPPAGYSWKSNALGNLVAVIDEEDPGATTLRSELISQSQAAPGTDAVGTYDVVAVTGKTLTTFLNEINVLLNTISTQATFKTGMASLYLGGVSDIPTGWVMMDDGSIGSAASGATTRANADTEALYTLLWNNVIDTWAPVATGRGASAAADFAADKAMTLPLQLGRSLATSGAGATLTTRVLGETLGEEDHQLTVAQLSAHTHVSSAQGSASTRPVGTGVPEAATNGASTGSTGSDTPHNTMQPTSFWNVIIKL